MNVTKEATGTTRLTVTLLPTPRSVGIARVFVRHHLISLGFHSRVDAGIIVASELVTNALAVGGPEVWLWCSPDRGRPLIEVWDASTELPKPPRVDLLAEAGRGLGIVNALAEDMGCRFLSNDWGGKVVWVLLK